VTRALNYAHGRGVTQVVSMSNSHTDLGNPHPDTVSPNFPRGTSHLRQIDNASCLQMPGEGPHTIGVSGLGPSKGKADYSNYGLEQISVSAPGGYFRDFFGTPQFQTRGNQILSTVSPQLPRRQGWIDAAGNITQAGLDRGVQKVTRPDGRVGYYFPAEGTSMAAPHATAVAALIISERGSFTSGQASMPPNQVRTILENSASETPCPEPRTVDYLDEGRDQTYTATCEGPPTFNGFYGHGIVNAHAAVS